MPHDKYSVGHKLGLLTHDSSEMEAVPNVVLLHRIYIYIKIAHE